MASARSSTSSTLPRPSRRAKPTNRWPAPGARRRHPPRPSRRAKPTNRVMGSTADFRTTGRTSSWRPTSSSTTSTSWRPTGAAGGGAFDCPERWPASRGRCYAGRWGRGSGRRGGQRALERRTGARRAPAPVGSLTGRDREATAHSKRRGHGFAPELLAGLCLPLRSWRQQTFNVRDALAERSDDAAQVVDIRAQLFHIAARRRCHAQAHQHHDDAEQDT